MNWQSNPKKHPYNYCCTINTRKPVQAIRDLIKRMEFQYRSFSNTSNLKFHNQLGRRF
jgi:hypothetical protein